MTKDRLFQSAILINHCLCLAVLSFLYFHLLPSLVRAFSRSLLLFSQTLQYVLKPTFTRQHISNLDKQGRLYRAYDGTTYLPGIVGLNNIKANDYANAVLQVHPQITDRSFSCSDKLAWFCVRQIWAY